MAYRDGPFENLKVPLAWTSAVVVVFVAIIAVLLLLSDRKEQDGTYAGPRTASDRAAEQVGGVFAAPVRWAGAVSDYVGGYFDAVGENRRLKKRLAELEPWRDQAIALKNINARYEVMLGLKTEPPVDMVTARSVSESRGPFSRSRLIDIGQEQGVRVGNPVINEQGLVGRVVGTTDSVSRVVLLTDVASKVPILVDRTDARALLSGDGSGNPRLEFVRGNDAVKAGDLIMTSGDGGGFPRGVPIGVAAKGIDGSWRVKLFSDRGAIDLVKVLLFEDFGQLADPEALNAPPLAALGAAPAPTPEAAAAIRDSQARRAAGGAAATPPATNAAPPAQARPTPATAGPAQTGGGAG